MTETQNLEQQDFFGDDESELLECFEQMEEELGDFLPEEGGSVDPDELDSADELDPHELGRRGEAAAVAFLKRAGYRIIERNWRCSAGEADIVAVDPDDELCFVEVKTRRKTSFGFPEESVTNTRRQRYEKIAIEYLSTHDVDSTVVRFDVISLVIIGPHRAFLRHHRNAFSRGE